MKNAAKYTIGTKPQALTAWPVFAVWGLFCQSALTAVSFDLDQLPGMQHRRRGEQNAVDNGIPGIPRGYRKRLFTD